MNKDLDKLLRRIDLEDYIDELQSVAEWGGADVIICSYLDETTEKWLGEAPVVISLQDTEPQRRVVITQFSKELSWLFYQLRDIFSDSLDSISKYDFYGLLAQTAINHLEKNKQSKLLLKAVLNEARRLIVANKRMNLPKNIQLPFFAYGLFKPGELCYFRIKDLVQTTSESEVAGRLKERDGVPLLVAPGHLQIKGALIHFQTGREEEAYKEIINIEPDKIYYWDEIKVSNGILANALLGKKSDKGTKEIEGIVVWNGKSDPFFKYALKEIETILEKNSDFNGDYKKLFRLQMAYTLLWAVIERYAGLRYYFKSKVKHKLNSIAEEESFSNNLKKHVKEERIIYAANNPKDTYKLDPNDPEESLKYYYQVRSNAVHRGKALHPDFHILTRIMRH